jgi:hypothetical protein
MQKLELSGESDQSWPEICLQVGTYLGLEGPAPDAVVQRAIDDPVYAHNLQVCRHQSALLAMLFKDAMANKPPTPSVGNSGEFAQPNAVTTQEQSNSELVMRAAKALANWAVSGFSTVDDGTYAKRLQACYRCPHLKDSSDRAVYRLMNTSGNAHKVCSLCGCVAERKAKLTTESCPGEDPAQPGRNRWGQALPAH